MPLGMGVSAKTVKTTWYWVDTLSQSNKEKIVNNDISETKYIKEKSDKKRKNVLSRSIISEDDAIGIKFYDSNGYKIEEPVQLFLRGVYRNHENLKQLNSLKQKLNIKEVDTGKELIYKFTKQNLKIGGIVVTGSIKKLKELRNNKSFIKSSTFGVIEDRF